MEVTTGLKRWNRLASNANSSLNETGEFMVVDGLHRLEALRDTSCDEPTNDEHKANRQIFSSI